MPDLFYYYNQSNYYTVMSLIDQLKPILKLRENPTPAPNHSSGDKLFPVGSSSNFQGITQIIYQHDL